ncbi:MAG: class I SAM-dependent methyltransferase [Vicingus serpentipes]|nr:class I SAM-dependent methyltransferase [Vicingus serpentipes]
MSGKRNFDNFDEFAVDYRKKHDDVVKISGGDSSYFSEYKITEMLKFEDSQSTIKILDFGCGDGNSSIFIRKHFPFTTIFGVDTSEQSIKIAKEKNIKNTFFTAYEGFILPYETESFDVVFSSMVFHHIDYKLHNAVLEEIYRVLKKGGRFYNFEHNPYNPLTRKIVAACEFDKHAVLLKPLYHQKIIEENGLKIKELRYTLFFPRQQIFKWLHHLEPLFSWLPLGAQYYIRAIK